MDGLTLCAIYAYPPNSKNYCGTKGYFKALQRWLKERDNREELEAELEKFNVHIAYLDFIASKTKKKRFDIENARAFWIGGKALESFNKKSMSIFIRELLKSDRTRVKKLIDILPSGLTPHHSFNSLFVNFVTKKVNKNVKNYDMCCITPAKITSLGKTIATGIRTTINIRNGKLVFIDKPSKMIIEKNGVRLVDKIKIGDIVTVHWGMVVEKISAKQRDILMKYTRKNMDAVNNISGREQTIRCLF
jgi:hydrogenase maturation factor